MHMVKRYIYVLTNDRMQGWVLLHSVCFAVEVFKLALKVQYYCNSSTRKA